MVKIMLNKQLILIETNRMGADSEEYKAYFAFFQKALVQKSLE